MAIKTKTRTINGVEYQVTQFGAMQGLRLAVRIAKLVAPGAAKAVGSGASLSTLLEKNVDLGGAVEAIADRLDVSDTPQFLRELLSATHRDRRDLGDEAEFNGAFAGNYGELLKALSFVLEVNYEDFFGALRQAVTGMAEAGGSAETSSLAN